MVVAVVVEGVVVVGGVTVVRVLPSRKVFMFISRVSLDFDYIVRIFFEVVFSSRNPERCCCGRRI